MVNIGKTFLGIVVVLAGIWMLVPTSVCGGIYCPGLWKELWFILKGVVPITLVGLGIVLIWVESE